MSLLLVPSMIALLGFGLTWYLNNSEQARQAEEAARAEVMRSQFTSLVAYLDQMSQAIVELNLRASEEDSDVRTMVQARTSAALRAVGPENKRTLLLFLYDSRLIDRRNTIISLVDADLSEANLGGSNLRASNLRGANLSNSRLSHADLSGAYLRGAYLRGADLSRADLSGADLIYADLGGADLSSAALGGADLDGADLSRADLSGADLSGAYLGGAIGVTEEQLEEQAKTLGGATMPDGSKHP
jgi:uncharacterized protein YjbI with pentapeptide repeats